jgi:hypothetical protein
MLLFPAAFIASAADEKGKVTVNKVEAGGWKNNLLLSNGSVELIATLDVGPRIISYRPVSGPNVGPNVFKNYAEQMGKTGEREWMIRGGHRLWAGPEDTTRTYFPDNGPVKYEEKDGWVRLLPPPETEYGIQKEIALRLEPTGTKVTVRHRITNVGDKETALAPWALSVMAPGGVEIIPLPAKRPHPGAAKNAKSAEDFAPNQLMVMWPFFDFADPRWHFGGKYITLRQDARRGPTKIGLAHRLGWVGYLNNHILFVKRFDYQKGQPYPDHGCNFETFTNEDMLEAESLGPVVRLAPGKAVEHTERWELFTDVPDFKNEAGIDENILPKVAAK